MVRREGFGIANMDDHSVVTTVDSGMVIFDVENKNNVLIVRYYDCVEDSYRRTC